MNGAQLKVIFADWPEETIEEAILMKVTLPPHIDVGAEGTVHMLYCHQSMRYLVLNVTLCPSLDPITSQETD